MRIYEHIYRKSAFRRRKFPVVNCAKDRMQEVILR